MYVPDNYDLFLAHDAEQARMLEKYPKCSACEDPILDDFCYEFDGVLICEDCLNEGHRRFTEHYKEL